MKSTVASSLSPPSARAPISAATCAARAVLESNTATSCPPFARLAAMGPPMLPTPKNATFMQAHPVLDRREYAALECYDSAPVFACAIRMPGKRGLAQKHPGRPRSVSLPAGPAAGCNCGRRDRLRQPHRCQQHHRPEQRAEGHET